MTYYATLGYAFSIGATNPPTGSVLLASGMPGHQLARRLRSKKNRHLSHLHTMLFDPQLYLAELDVTQNIETCVKLASYPWFQTPNVATYDSGEIRQAQWRQATRQLIMQSWNQRTPVDIEASVRACVDFQQQIQCSEIILPAPLTNDYSGRYELEQEWLDAGLDYLSHLELEKPCYWTVALSDSCLRLLPAENNELLATMADAISARNVTHVYLVLEQGSAPDSTRHAADVRTLEALMSFTHQLSSDCEIKFGINFVGAFGAVLHSLSSGFWASNWYKSLYRVRLADRLGKGRAYPTYWSRHVASDIHLRADLDAIAGDDIWQAIEDRTGNSSNLLNALASGLRVGDVNAWRYSQGNVSAAMDHFVSSLNQLDHAMCQSTNRLAHVRSWLEQAARNVQAIQQRGLTSDTSFAHIAAWHAALENFCRRENL